MCADYDDIVGLALGDVMSTTITIAITEDLHVYFECLDDSVYLQRDSTEETTKIFSKQEWSEIRAQIIKRFLQQLQLGCVDEKSTPKCVWDKHPHDEGKILTNLSMLLSNMETK